MPSENGVNHGCQDTAGELDFRKDVLSFPSTKGGRYSPLEEKNSQF